MRYTWWIVLIVVLAIIGIIWYAQKGSGVATPAPAAVQTTPQPESGPAAATGATPAPAAAITSRDTSDASINADLNDINSQMNGLSADSQAAQ